MSLIFDQFPSTESAEAFVVSVKERFGLDGAVYASQDDSNKDDPFPWRLDPPIVLVDRIDDDGLIGIDALVDAERDVEEAVIPFGGEFAGT